MRVILTGSRIAWLAIKAKHNTSRANALWGQHTCQPWSFATTLRCGDLGGSIQIHVIPFWEYIIIVGDITIKSLTIQEFQASYKCLFLMIISLLRVILLQALDKSQLGDIVRAKEEKLDSPGELPSPSLYPLNPVNRLITRLLTSFVSEYDWRHHKNSQRWWVLDFCLVQWM